jgi:hypothetical protein
MFNSGEFLSINKITPERELLIAILDRAVLDFCGREGELHERARDWLFGETDPENLFSFEAICEHLGINTSALRKRVLEINIPKHVSQAHRWLRSKVQSENSSCGAA